MRFYRNNVKRKSDKNIVKGWSDIANFIDDLAGAVYDVLKFVLQSVGYIIAGMLIVAIPLYLIVWVLELMQ